MTSIWTRRHFTRLRLFWADILDSVRLGSEIFFARTWDGMDPHDPALHDTQSLLRLTIHLRLLIIAFSTHLEFGIQAWG